MQNDLIQIAKSFKIDIEDSNLNELYDYFKLAEDYCSFLFDIESEKCCYLSPSIRNILGYTQQKFIDHGFLFLKTIIHTQDFSYLLTEIITLVKITDNINGISCNINNISLPFRVKHRNGHWLKLIIHLTCIKKKSNIGINILIGSIEKDIIIQDKSFISDFAITSREKEILKYLAAGNSAKTIASKLFISEYTVITHRKHLIQKLKVKNSAELIKKSFELNILN